MANELHTVEPGDLITSEFMNDIVELLQSLENRVAILEALESGGDAVIIISLFPAGPIRVGQELQVSGHNFGLSVGSSVVYVDNVLVTSYKSGSNDELLIFDIPGLDNIPIAGRTATLIVANQTSSVQRTVYVLPAQPLQGSVDVSWLDVTPTIINPTSIATFEFRFQSRTNLDATYILTPAIEVAGNSSEWLSRMEILDNTQNPVTSRMLSVAAGDNTNFFVRINPVPDVAADTPFILSVTASANGVEGKTSPVYVTLGQTVELPDPNVSMIFQSAAFLPENSGSIQIGEIQDSIRLQAGAESLIKFVAEFRAVGVYDVIIEPVTAETNNWGLTLHPEQSATITITEPMLDNPDQRHDEVPMYIISALAGASATGEVEFKIRHQDADVSRSVRMKLIRI